MAGGARLLLVLSVALLLATSANASPNASAPAPTGLRTFLFRADEAPRREYARTPSFAWKPVSGAVRYEFELSTSASFRENGIVFAERRLKSPVAAITLTLPWITGSPYALYARVRAVLPKRTSAWSRPYGFDMRQPNVPRPLASPPGLLRWNPIEGAGGYQIWLVDVGKFVTTQTNVLDQREFFTFHTGDPWISNVRWRIRTLRWDVAEEGKPRANGLPATSWGPWSPVYESQNPSFERGPIRLVGTLSDVSVEGRAADRAHRLMPAFTFAGDSTLSGTTAELFRVYVFTDRDCVNRVFTGAIVGSPAYSPRPFGPLALPRTAAAVALMRGDYLADGQEGATYAADSEEITSNESLPASVPTTTLPSLEAAPATAPGDGSTGGTATSGDSGSVKFLTVTGDLGAPVDLWDTNWPQGGYYWTVVAVEAAAPTSHSTSVAGAGAVLGSTSLPVVSVAGFAVGDLVEVGNLANLESVTVTGTSGNALQLATPLTQSHGGGEPVARKSGPLAYIDLELPQEVCAAGRVQRFGKSSEPTLVASGAPFASGLSPRGRLTAAVPGSASFYGSPLVAWAPALGADAYHVQWSRTRSPFKPEPAALAGKGAAAGLLTFGTAATLALKPGTWWYRVRGVSFRLPEKGQFMSWSDPTRLVVAKPTFTVKR